MNSGLVTVNYVTVTIMEEQFIINVKHAGWAKVAPQPFIPLLQAKMKGGTTRFGPPCIMILKYLFIDVHRELFLTVL